MKAKVKIVPVLHNIRSTYNVGAIWRTAEGLGVERIILSGYTPRYNDTRLLPHLQEKLNRQITKAALGAEEMVPSEAVDDLGTWLTAGRERGSIILGLENNLASEELPRQLILGEKLPDWPEDARILLILGEEVAGIPPEVRSECDYFLEIPMCGRKESFNVSVAAGIGMWGLGQSFPLV